MNLHIRVERGKVWHFAEEAHVSVFVMKTRLQKSKKNQENTLFYC